MQHQHDHADDATVDTDSPAPDPSNTEIEMLVEPLASGDDIHDRMTALNPVVEGATCDVPD